MSTRTPQTGVSTWSGRWRRARLCVALGLGLAVAPASAHAETGTAPCEVSIDGHAVDIVTHEAVFGATVSVNGVVLGETDHDGRFVLKQPCGSTVTLDLESADFRTATHTLILPESPGTTSLELELAAQAMEVIVVAGRATPVINMRSTAVISGKALEQTRGKALADVVATVPGVAKLQSASGMAKPVVRGQFGRRLQLVVNGIRHRAQEWGLDHTPEIDPFSAGQISVVRGAAAVQYGPDAIGGAITVDPPDMLTAPGHDGELHLVGTSNGLGGSFAARLRGVPALATKLAWTVEASTNRTASPRTPDYALNNTARAEWNAGGRLNYKFDASDVQLSFSHYQAKQGVCTCLRIESVEDFYTQLALAAPSDVELYDSTFTINRAFQEVSHDLAIARNHIDLGSTGTLTTTYAFQHDLRREYDHARQSTTGAQFNFRLQTHELETSFKHRPVHLSDHWHVRGDLGATAVVQTHAYNGLPLIPDYDAYGGALFAVERLMGHDTEIEAGLRYDVLSRKAQLERLDFLRLVRSGQLANDACGDSSAETIRCGSLFHTLSASLGALQQLSSELSVKLDLSTASRPPNPDEQFLNGTSPTFPVFGLGKPDLGPETTYSASATTLLAQENVNAEVSLFFNRIEDYINFLPAVGPDGKPLFDVIIRGTFPRFITRPIDAVFLGADGGIDWSPNKSLTLSGQFSWVRASSAADGQPLAFVPAGRLRGVVTYHAPAMGPLHDSYITVNGVAVDRQRRTNVATDFAPPPPGYVLVGAEVGTQLRIAEHDVHVAFSGNNLLNTRYRDYTSLLRYFADEPGMQLALRISVHFGVDRSNPTTK